MLKCHMLEKIEWDLQPCLQQRALKFILSFISSCPLVPVFGFGQNDVFNKQPKFKFLQTYESGRSTWEKWTKVFLKSVMQVMFGRFGILPYPRPITVVGEFQEKLSNIYYISSDKKLLMH